MESLKKSMWILLCQEFYCSHSYIIREGDLGDKFFIIHGGSVRITKLNSYGVEEELTVLEKGDYFGEKALYDNGDTKRQANAIALPPGTECFTIDREYVTHFYILISLFNKNWNLFYAAFLQFFIINCRTRIRNYT